MPVFVLQVLDVLHPGRANVSKVRPAARRLRNAPSAVGGAGVAEMACSAAI